uniref:FZ domain-containing protein n=2 Tax=Panagrellus redivivus TaxID=6233 RepID=A0A7E4W443_PANRE
MSCMRAVWFGWVFLLVSVKVEGAHVSSMIHLACNRNPHLSICKALEAIPSGHDNENAQRAVVPTEILLRDDSVDITKDHSSSEEQAQSTEGDRNTTSVVPSEAEISADSLSTTTTTTVEPVSTELFTTTTTKPIISNTQVDVTKSQFIRLRSYASSVEGLNENPFVGHSKVSLLEQSKEKYCHTYVPKYTFYCQGPGRLTVPEKNQPRLAAFCFSVKDTCFPEQITPCTPDCDEKMHTHCTASCKCDYLYPLIVKFCAPLAVPFLENVCRSWFVGCAKMYALDIMDVDTFLFPPDVKSQSIWIKDDVLPLETQAVKKPRQRIHQAKNFPIVASDVDVPSSGGFHKFDQFTDQSGVLHRPRSRSPWSKPGLWEANPDNPHNRDHANKFYYAPRSVTADWLSGQVFWGAHWAVPAAGVGGTDGFSAIHFPSLASFLNIADDYD